MAAVDDPKTYGRARLGFADQADVDEFADTLDRFERGEIGPDAWRAFRLVRGTYGQRQAEDAQMLRVKIPQGILTGPAAPRARRRRRPLFARLRSHHDPAERAVSFHEAARRRAGDAPDGRRRADDARGVRQRGPNHHRLPARRRRRRRGVRRHAVRRGADPPSAAASAQLEAAAQVQDRFRGMPRPITRGPASTTSASAPRSVPRGRAGFRVTVAGGTSIMPRAGALLHAFLLASEIFDVTDAILRVYAALGDYQHKQRNRLKFLIKSLGWERWYEEYRTALAAVRLEPDRTLPLRSRPPAGRRRSRTGSPARRRRSPRSSRGRNAAELRGPGIHPSPIDAGPGGFDRWMRTNVHPQKQDGFAAAVATSPARRRDRGAAPDLRAISRRRMATARCGSRPIRTPSFAGCRWRVSRSSTARSPPPVSAWPTRARSPTSSAAPAPSPAASPSRSRAGSDGCSAITSARSPDAAEAVGAADIKISGCPNGCGLHHVAVDRLPGQHPQASAAARGAAVLRHGRRRRRRRRRVLRPHRRARFPPAAARRRSTASSPSTAGNARTTRAWPRSCAARTRRG